tara:strand:+ start:2062 stop:2250 length:189 start_codon:yes stop_codon:yes gene_type:complete
MVFSLRSSSNQIVEKPDKGKAITLLSLKEKIGSKSAGAYKKIKKDITIILKILFDFFILVIF